MTFDNPTSPWHYSYQRICNRLLVVTIGLVLLSMSIFFNGLAMTALGIVAAIATICAAVMAGSLVIGLLYLLVVWALDLR